MKNLKTYILLAISFLLALSACKKSNELTPEESKELLNSLTTDVKTQIQTLETSKTLDAAKSIYSLQNVSNIKAKSLYLSKTIKTGFIDRYIKKVTTKQVKNDDDRFVFDENTGTYTWNSETQDWDYTSTPTDKIVIKFPEENSVTNNCVLTIYKYSDVAISDEWGTEYLAAEILADLVIDGNKEAELNFKASYDDNGDPIAADIYLMVKPFEAKLKFNISNKILSIEASLQAGDEMITSTSLTFTFMDNSLDEVQKVEGYAQYGSIKMTGWVNVEDINELDDNAPIDKVNECFDLKLYTYPDEKYIGYIEAYVDNDGEIDAKIVFPDGSFVYASDYTQQIEAQIQEFLKDLERQFSDVK